MKHQNVFVACNVGLCGIISVVVTILGFYKIYLHWNSSFIIKRERVLHVQFLFCIFFMQISTLYTIICAQFYGRDSLIYIIGKMAVMVGYWLILCNILVIRWLLYYNINWILATMKSKWEYIIIGNHRDNHKINWFIRNKGKYGQYNRIRIYIKVITGIMCILTCVVYGLEKATIIPGKTYLISVAPGGSIMIILLGVIIYKTPKYIDQFYIKQESQLHLLFGLVLFSVYVCHIFVRINVPNEYNVMGSSISTSIMVYIWNGIFIVSSFVIVYKNDINKLSNIDSIDICLEYTLRNQHTMELFIEHLYKEYNIELITSYIEVNYLLKEFIQLNDIINTFKEHKYIEIFYDELSDVIVRKSEYINSKYQEINRKDKNSILKVHCGIIYTKYIYEYSEFQINISGPLKCKFERIIIDNEFDLNNNTNYMELFNILYDIKKEMHKMLGFSFERFKKNDHFIKIKDVLKIHV